MNWYKTLGVVFFGGMISISAIAQDRNEDFYDDDNLQEQQLENQREREDSFANPAHRETNQDDWYDSDADAYVYDDQRYRTDPAYRAGFDAGVRDRDQRENRREGFANPRLRSPSEDRNIDYRHDRDWRDRDYREDRDIRDNRRGVSNNPANQRPRGEQDFNYDRDDVTYRDNRDVDFRYRDDYRNRRNTTTDINDDEGWPDNYRQEVGQDHISRSEMEEYRDSDDWRERNPEYPNMDRDADEERHAFGNQRLRGTTDEDELDEDWREERRQNRN